MGNSISQQNNFSNSKSKIDGQFSLELFNYLPIEIQDQILLYLDWNDIHSCWQAGWKNILFSQHNYVFRHLLYKDIIQQSYFKGFFFNHCKDLQRKYQVKSLGLTLLKLHTNICFTCMTTIKKKYTYTNLHPFFNFYICNRCKKLDPRLQLINYSTMKSIIPKHKSKLITTISFTKRRKKMIFEKSYCLKRDVETIRHEQNPIPLEPILLVCKSSWKNLTYPIFINNLPISDNSKLDLSKPHKCKRFIIPTKPKKSILITIPAHRKQSNYNY